MKLVDLASIVKKQRVMIKTMKEKLEEINDKLFVQSVTEDDALKIKSIFKFLTSRTFDLKSQVTNLITTVFASRISNKRSLSQEEKVFVNFFSVVIILLFFSFVFLFVTVFS